MRTALRHDDSPNGADAELRRHDRPLTIAFVIIAAAVIAAIVTLALEPDTVQVAAMAPPAQLDPCDNQTWPHFSAACIASKSAARPR